MATIAKIPNDAPSASETHSALPGSTAASSRRSTQIKATKIGVWKIGDQYFEELEPAEREVRRLVVLELLSEDSPEAEVMMGSDEDVAAWVAVNWSLVEKRFKEAFAGS